MLIVLFPGDGQMCNQMLMQMNVLASAYKYGYKVKYYGYKRYNGPLYNEESLNGIISERERVPLFRVTLARAIKKASKYVFVSKRLIFGEDAESVNAFLASDTKVNKRFYCIGWPFYDLPSLRENVDLIRKYYAPNNDILEYVAKEFSIYRQNSSITVGVHLRRGDYRTWRGGEFFFEDSVYKRYMDMLWEQLEIKNITFILFSNETLELEHFKSEQYNVFCAHGTAIQDFYLMSKCEYLIGPPSSYSGLASFLGNVPRYIIINASDEFRIDKMHVWLQETDGWINSI